MRIAFIGQKGMPVKFGGVERHVEELASEMVKSGHEVFVYVRNNYTPKDLSEYRGVKLIHLPSISTKNLDAISHTFLASIHALFCKYDVVHYQAIGPSVLSWIIKIFKRKTAVVSTFHCQDYYHKKWSWFAVKFLQLGEWASCKIPDRTIVVSCSLDGYAKDKYKINPKIIHNGVRIEDVDNIDFNILKKWKLEKNKYVVFVGRLIKHKGAHHLIRAFKDLERENKIPQGFKLAIVGDGFYTDDYLKELKYLAGEDDNIIFTGNLVGDELATVFSGAYLFVQPSESEGLSISLLEAMSHGVPVLASDIRENADVIKDMGETFKTNDLADLKNKLKEIITGNVDFSQKIKKAKQEVEEKYDWKNISQKTIDLYREILAEKDK